MGRAPLNAYKIRDPRKRRVTSLKRARGLTDKAHDYGSVTGTPPFLAVMTADARRLDIYCSSKDLLNEPSDVTIERIIDFEVEKLKQFVKNNPKKVTVTGPSDFSQISVQRCKGYEDPKTGKWKKCNGLNKDNKPCAHEKKDGKYVKNIRNDPKLIFKMDKDEKNEAAKNKNNGDEDLKQKKKRSRKSEKAEKELTKVDEKKPRRKRSKKNEISADDYADGKEEIELDPTSPQQTPSDSQDQIQVVTLRPIPKNDTLMPVATTTTTTTTTSKSTLTSGLPLDCRGEDYLRLFSGDSNEEDELVAQGNNIDDDSLVQSFFNHDQHGENEYPFTNLTLPHLNLTQPQHNHTFAQANTHSPESLQLPPIQNNNTLAVRSNGFGHQNEPMVIGSNLTQSILQMQTNPSFSISSNRKEVDVSVCDINVRMNNMRFFFKDVIEDASSPSEVPSFFSSFANGNKNPNINMFSASFNHTPPGPTPFSSFMKSFS